MASTLVYGDKGIYRSPRPPISLPADQTLSMIPFLFRNTAHSQNSALIDADTSDVLTFSDLRTTVLNLARALRRLNIAKNDVVLICSPNSIAFVVSFLAIVSIGAIATTVNPAYTVTELSNQLKDCNPKLIVTVGQVYHKVQHFNLPSIILDSKPPNHEIAHNAGVWYYSDLIKCPGDETPDSPAVAQSDIAALLYSSGTTGKSKGVVLTHRNFIATALMVTADQEYYGDGRNVFMCFLPIFHISGLSGIVYAQLQRGNTVVLMGRFEMGRVLGTIEKYRVTHTYVVPPVVVVLAKQRAALLETYDLSSLKEMGSGAAPLAKDVMEECAKNFPHTVIHQVSP